MKTDFDRIIDRRGSGCYKYDALRQLYGREDLLPLSVADMDFEVSPAIRAALQKRLDHGIFGYNFRTPDFHAAVIAWIEKQYGYRIERDWMLPSPGIMPAVNLAVLEYTQPGDGVLVQAPVYPPFFTAVTSHKRKLLINQLVLSDGQYSIDFDDFESKASQAKLFILCSPHNPVGRVWTETELLRIGDICRRHKVKVISDEIHADLVYEGGKALSIAALEDFADLAMVCVSPAKSFNIAGLSTAIIVIKDEALRKPMYSIIEKLHLYMGNSFGIAATLAAYRDSADWLREALIYLQDNRDYLAGFLRAELPQLKLTIPQSTYLAWIDCRALGLDDAELAAWLVREPGLALDAGSRFGPGGTGFQRLNFACPRAVLKDALLRLKAAVEDLCKKR